VSQYTIRKLPGCILGEGEGNEIQVWLNENEAAIRKTGKVLVRPCYRQRFSAHGLG